ncbi:chaperone NapD [Uliginosibacterium sp. H1]|uniref:chaperone NapD n=1 Tax=Uliginosibacterium sp. H1 TaxID=3114757 RepID=UPI002E19C95A|nr:chaperone NapD [Uliginosibacterium sp. H1]
MTEELHIASLVVHAAPGRGESVATEISSHESAQIHASTPTGKLVVTLEADSAGQMMDRIGAIQKLDGVLSAALVYQHADTLAAMNETIEEPVHDDY